MTYDEAMNWISADFSQPTKAYTCSIEPGGNEGCYFTVFGRVYRCNVLEADSREAAQIFSTLVNHRIEQGLVQ